jgi:hypothetical protein
VLFEWKCMYRMCWRCVHDAFRNELFVLREYSSAVIFLLRFAVDLNACGCNAVLKTVNGNGRVTGNGLAWPVPNLCVGRCWLCNRCHTTWGHQRFVTWCLLCMRGARQRFCSGRARLSKGGGGGGWVALGHALHCLLAGRKSKRVPS